MQALHSTDGDHVQRLQVESLHTKDRLLPWSCVQSWVWGYEAVAAAALSLWIMASRKNSPAL